MASGGDGDCDLAAIWPLLQAHEDGGGEAVGVRAQQGAVEGVDDRRGVAVEHRRSPECVAGEGGLDAACGPLPHTSPSTTPHAFSPMAKTS